MADERMGTTWFSFSGKNAPAEELGQRRRCEDVKAQRSATCYVVM
jgi:hypothetical protein